jgi:hypothetical protein
MYARPLFVVVGFFAPHFGPFYPLCPAVLSELRLGIAEGCGYTLAA